MDNNDKFDYFRSTVRFTGRHKVYIDAIWKQNDIKESFIKTLYELYGIAAIIGLRTNNKSEVDPDQNEVRNLQSDQLLNYRSVLNTIMTTVLLLDESTGLSEEERINRAFKKPTTVEQFNENVELFNSYVRGGIEYLYDALVVRTLSDESAYTDVRIENIIALIENPFE